MKEEHIWTKKPETMLDWFCVVGACIALYLTLNNLGYFLGKIGVFIGIVSPFAGGIVIAYVLDPMVKFFYTKLFKEKKKTRGFAILLAYLVAILLLVLLAWLVIPQIVDSIAMLFTNFPSYIHSVQDMLGMVQERFGVDLSSATKVLDDSEAMVKEIYSMASAAMPQIVPASAVWHRTLWRSSPRLRPVSICWRTRSICSISCARWRMPPGRNRLPKTRCASANMPR